MPVELAIRGRPGCKWCCSDEIISVFDRSVLIFRFQSENVSICTTFGFGLDFCLAFFFIFIWGFFSFFFFYTVSTFLKQGKNQHNLEFFFLKKTNFLPAAAMEMFQPERWWSNLNICHGTQDVTSLVGLLPWGIEAVKITPSPCLFVTFSPASLAVPGHISSTDGLRSCR